MVSLFSGLMSPNYTSLLATVQRIYDQLDEIETWEMLISDIRKEFKNLPALKDELNKAGL